MTELITSVLIISGIGALLALLIEIANRFIADYGESHILINQAKDLVVEGGNPLLFTLMDEGIFLPSACGGKGTCAYCKIKVQEGGGPVLPTETPYLTEGEIRENVRLSCQIKVRNDLKIEIPEELFLIREYQVRVDRIIDQTPTIKSIILQIQSPEAGITFKPGQYIQLQVPKYKLSKEPEFRAFSIASPKRESQRIELIVARVESGVVSTYILDFLKEGDKLTMRGPFGDFYYRHSERELLLIATGSGLAPLLSILDYLETEKIRRKTTLFFGSRKPEDLYHLKEITEMAGNLFNCKFTPILSRTTAETKWTGEKGRVTDLIEKNVPQNADTDVYICGNPDMVESCLELLKTKGIPESQIYFDKFS